MKWAHVRGLNLFIYSCVEDMVSVCIQMRSVWPSNCHTMKACVLTPHYCILITVRQQRATALLFWAHSQMTDMSYRFSRHHKASRLVWFHCFCYSLARDMHALLAESKALGLRAVYVSLSHGFYLALLMVCCWNILKHWFSWLGNFSYVNGD